MRRDRMFAKLQRQIDADSRLLEEARRDAAMRAEREEARLAEPLTMREVLDALETVASEYGGNGNHDSDLIADAFRKLKEALS